MTPLPPSPPEDIMRAFIAGLARAQGDTLGARAAFRETMALLLRLRTSQALLGPADAASLKRFREESAQAMLPLADRISFLVNQALILAEDCGDGGWLDLCERRTEIQFLMDDYAGTPIPGLIDRNDLAELDETMPDAGDRWGPLEAHEIPRGIPASHWWWWYPDAPQDTQNPAGDSFAPVAGDGDAPDAASSAARGTLVLDPQQAFAGLSNTLAAQGWQVVTASQQPIVPGEPEHALFERAAQHLGYSFNPVCRLRLIEVPLDLDDATVASLPVQNVEDVLPWFSSQDERTQLRGVLAAAYLPHPLMHAALEPLHQHPRASIANAAKQSSTAIEAVLRSDDLARSTALAAIEILKQELTPLIHALASDVDGKLSAALQPQESDYARAFHPQIADAARQAYEALWANPPRVSSMPSGSQLKLNVAPAGMLAEDNELSRHFPGGYRAIAPFLNSRCVWVAWKLIAPGKSAGMAYDGLVWLDDHWVWFPKPYRVLADLIKS